MRDSSVSRNCRDAASPPRPSTMTVNEKIQPKPWYSRFANIDENPNEGCADSSPATTPIVDATAAPMYGVGSKITKGQRPFYETQKVWVQVFRFRV